jgi:hypothetical protein
MDEVLQQKVEALEGELGELKLKFMALEVRVAKLEGAVGGLSQTIHLGIDAVDSSSILARSRDVAEAIQKELQLGNQGLKNALSQK